jgi:hypothetical protein
MPQYSDATKDNQFKLSRKNIDCNADNTDSKGQITYPSTSRTLQNIHIQKPLDILSSASKEN